MPRYRRALRAALSIEPDAWEPPDPTWSDEARAAFLAGVLAAARAVTAEVARVLGAVPPAGEASQPAGREPSGARPRPGVRPRPGTTAAGEPGES